MKKFLLLMIVIFVAFQFIGYSQTALEVVWEKTAPIADIKFTRFAPDGKSIYCANNNSIAQVSAENGDVLWSVGGIQSITDLDVSALGNYFVTANEFDGAGIWDAKTNKLLYYAKSDTNGGNYALRTIMSPDEKYVLISFHKNNQQYIAVYDLQKQQVTKLIPCAYRIANMRFSHNGKTFATSGYLTVKPDPYTTENHDRLYLYDGETFEQIAILADTIGSNIGFRSLQYSLDDNRICYIMNAKEGKSIDLEKKNILFNYRELTNTKSLGSIDYFSNPDNIMCSFLDHLNGVYELKIFNSNKEVNKYLIKGAGITTKITEGLFSILISSGQYLTMLHPDYTSVNNEIQTLMTVNNENNKEIILSYKNMSNQRINIMISNIEGKQLYISSFEIAEQNGQIKLENELPSGIYLYKITTTEKVFTGKFEVVK